MPNKYIEYASGGLREREALAQSTGASDAGKLIATDTAGKIDSSLLPVGTGEDTAMITASENLNTGDFVNIHNNAGTPNIRKADASNGRLAHGFVLVAVTSGAQGKVYFDSSNTALTGLTIGANYFLSATTAGQATATPPSGSGHIVQALGIARSATTLSFEPDQPITLA